ncbi:orotidine 5'-phosphate decarboxylase [Bacillus infantis]|uniref:3-hexulose-6-phosphate synthase n=1 Tax=Bacillus infantis TaxID=324767 RepID=UPI001CD7C2D3|nr:3-hexulose-6-phosphate synthase [Bacillus infantis]MCA1033639.1 orotidine 5'-phosphate decarboxylase [Bacillus infantis]
MMKVQLALDRLTNEECFRIVKEAYENIDWIEIGTGVIKEYGMDIIRSMKKEFPEKVLVADMKTCDAGRHEANQAFGAGADIVTVMGFSHNGTIKETLEAAEAYGKRIMIDLLGIQDSARAREIHQLGARLFCLHIGKDMQKEGQLADPALFQAAEGLEDSEIAIAGGISEKTIGTLKNSIVDIAIVGSAITGSEKPGASSLSLKRLIGADL